MNERLKNDINSTLLFFYYFRRFFFVQNACHSLYIYLRCLFEPGKVYRDILNFSQFNEFNDLAVGEISEVNDFFFIQTL